MRIVIDSVAIYGSKDRGIGKYTINQFDAIIEANPQDEFFYVNYYDTPHVGVYLKEQSNLTEISLYTGKNCVLAKDPRYQELLGSMIRGVIDRYSIEVFYVTSPFNCEDICTYQEKWFGNAKVVATFYDLIPLLFKEHYLQDPQAKKLYLNRLESLRWMDHFFAISRSAREDLCDKVGIDSSCVSVIWGAPDKRFTSIDYPVAERTALRKKFHISNPFIMCTAGDDERKNIEGLIIAYAALPEELVRKYQLVIVCKLSESSIKRYRKVAEDHHVKARVVFTNFVTDDELLRLYNEAYLLAFVSKYEGFGLPVVEAYACGLPVVTSNNSSLKEVAGDAAITVDPFDVSDISRGLQQALLETAEKRKSRKACGEQLLKGFDWRIAANVVSDVLHQMGSAASQTEGSTLAMFTPLPPIESGISDYSVDLITEIASRYQQIDVFIDDGYTPSCVLPDNVRVLHYKKFRNSSYYDAIVYQFGNSTYHTYMIDILRKYPGIIELHDANLHGLALALTIGTGNLLQYREMVRADFSEEATEKLIETEQRTDFSPDKAILNGFVVNYARKVIVHSDWAKRCLLEKDIGRDVYMIPLHVKMSEMPDKTQCRKQYGYDEKDIIIAAFGLVSNTKRVIPVVKACEKLWDEGYRFKLLFGGKIIEENVQNFFDELRRDPVTQERVKVTGFLELSEFLDYMDMADICLNLRYPYNGETSAACCRLLAKGKCVLVNDVGAFSEIPDDTCVKLPKVESLTPNQEIQEIYSHLKELLDCPEKVALKEKAAYDYASQHLALPVIGKAYVQAVNAPARTELTESDLCTFAKNELEGYSEEEIRKICEELSKTK